MKILHVGKYYNPVPGGIEKHVQQISEELVNRGHRVACLVSSGSEKPGRTKVNGVHVKRIRTLRKGKPPCHPQLFYHIKKMTGDIVHVHMPNPSGEVGTLLARPKKLIVSYHADIMGRNRQWYMPIQRALLRRANKILVSSESIINSPQLREFKEKCVVAPYGVENTEHKARKGPHPLYLCVGRLVSYKGFNNAIKSMKDVDGVLWIVGQGPEYSKLKTLRNKLGLEDKVFFFREVDDGELPSYYAAADVFILPSVNKAEAFGIAQLEAMRESVPVISTRLGTGTDWVNIDGKTGIVVNPNNVNELKEAMIMLQDNKLRKRLGNGAKKRASEFTHKRTVDIIENVYKEILKKE